MSKKFNIHEWQANQAKKYLAEGKLFEEDFKNPILDKYLELKKSIDYKTVFPTDLQSFLDSLDNTERKGLKRDLSKSLNKMNSQGDMFGRGPAYQELDSGIQYYIDEFIKDIEEGNKKDGTEYLNDLIKAIVALRDSATYEDDLEEASMTGTGASFTAGSGAGYMTPNAFKKKKKN